MENSLEKGKSVPVGTITNGFKKIAEGKWRKVSESHGMTKEEHEKKAQEHRTNMETSNKDNKGHIYHREMSFRDTHKELASKLDSKEYSDVDVVGKEKGEKQMFDIGHKVKFFDNGRNKDFTGKITNFKYKDGKIYYDIKIDGRTDISKNVKQSDIGVVKATDKEQVKKSTADELRKALTTLEIGYLQGAVTEDTIQSARDNFEKATGERSGHKYFKRESNGKGGWKYYYTEDQYKKEKGESKRGSDNNDKDQLKRESERNNKVGSEIKYSNGIPYKKQKDGTYLPDRDSELKSVDNLKSLSPIQNVNYKGHVVSLTNSSYGYNLKINSESLGNFSYNSNTKKLDWEVQKNGTRYSKDFNTKEELVDYCLKTFF